MRLCTIISLLLISEGKNLHVIASHVDFLSRDQRCSWSVRISNFPEMLVRFLSFLDHSLVQSAEHFLYHHHTFLTSHCLSFWRILPNHTFLASYCLSFLTHSFQSWFFLLTFLASLPDLSSSSPSLPAGFSCIKLTSFHKLETFSAAVPQVYSSKWRVF